MKNLIYLAGPISGLSYGESTDWRQYVMDNLHEDVEGLSPLRAKDYLKEEACLGDQYADRGDPVHAIMSYKEAWRYAMRVLAI